MADIAQIQVQGVTYDIKDPIARRVATEELVGNVKVDGVTTTVDADGTIHATGAGGSNLYISTFESSLFGKTVTVSDGVFTEMTELDENGKATISQFMGTGWVTITATNDEGKVAYGYADCSYYGTYRVTLGFFTATVNLKTNERMLYGGPVYVSSEVAPDETLTFDYTGKAQYIVHAPGRYTFSIV